MAIKILLPRDDESDDLMLRMPRAQYIALYKLLGQLSRDELRAKGLSDEECLWIENVYHSIL